MYQHKMINEEEEMDHHINHDINHLLETKSTHSFQNNFQIKPLVSTQSSRSSL